MYKYEIQFLGRTKDDFDRHMGVAANSNPAGRIEFKSYYFAGIKGLIVFLENKTDRDAILGAVPRNELVGAWEIGAVARAAA
ncbi:MAG: hypothetical protein ISR47_10055 [Rhodospirillales bacterium]|nr:hypothetical protein [Rhodospirillales bacterium]